VDGGVGIDKEMVINTGSWDFAFHDASANKATVDRYPRDNPADRHLGAHGPQRLVAV
jgi:hypothetical protein